MCVSAGLGIDWRNRGPRMYQRALEQLGQTVQTRIKTCIAQWQTDGGARWSQIAANIVNETALCADDFAALLQKLCGELNNGADPKNAWITACRAHQFKGHQMTDDERPGMLGRAIGRKRFARHMCDSNPMFDLEEAQELIWAACQAGSQVSPYQERILRRAPLGRFVIWATFCKETPHKEPFAGLPHKAEHICTALGLDALDPTDSWVLVTYQTQKGDTAIELYRPTIAEAADDPLYRPHKDGNAAHGWTHPLQPNPVGLNPRPEVVHGETTGETLVFPVYEAL
ncbi:MAG: hypothetical protein ACLFV4_00660 [Candidatus Hydrogenedentota bacterium]